SVMVLVFWHDRSDRFGISRGAARLKSGEDSRVEAIDRSRGGLDGDELLQNVRGERSRAHWLGESGGQPRNLRRHVQRGNKCWPAEQRREDIVGGAQVTHLAQGDSHDLRGY